MKHLIVACLLALAFVGSLKAAPDDQLVAVYNTQLRPENETNSSTSQAWGHAQVKVYASGLIEWKVKINNPAGETFTAGHIHRGAEGIAGPVVQAFLGGATTTDTHIDLRGFATNPVLAAALIANPENYYVNFHTTTNGPGAIRGQLP
jgi:hypothetical protein